MRIAVFFIMFFFSTQLIAQKDTSKVESGYQKIDGYIVPSRIIDGDTVPYIYIDEVVIFPPKTFKNDYARKQYYRKYNRLTRYVKKVYPYSIIIREKLQEIDAHLATLKTNKEKEEYINKAESELREEFEGQLRKMTILQGRILIKLVDRETGKTTYDLVKRLKGSVSAFFWQSVARVFGSNLKSEYDAEGDDKMIEEIIILIESGQL